MSNEGSAEKDGSTGTGFEPTGTDTFRRIAELLDQVSTGLLVVDVASTVTAWNRTAVDLLGLDDEPGGREVSRVVGSTGIDIDAAVEKSFRTGEVVEFETPLDRDEPIEVRVAPIGDAVALAMRDVGERVAMRRELRRSGRILETLDDGVYTLDEAFVITSVNDAITTITGYDREELVGSHASMLAGSETIEMADEIIDRLRGDGSDVGMIESTIRTADGDELPIETHFSTVEFGSGRKRRVGVIRDLSERRRSERILRELNLSARRFLRADTERTVYETVLDVTTTVWPDATVVAYSFDEVESVLEPVVASGELPGPRGPGSTVWEEFLTGEDGVTVPTDVSSPARSDVHDETHPSGRVVERSDDGTVSTVRTLYASLDEHGLLYAEIPGWKNVNNVRESVELVAANAVAALGRVTRETELSRQSEALTERNRTLKRLHELNDLIRRVNGALVDADTLQEVGDAVCALLVDADPVRFAWFGETYLTGGGLDLVSDAGDDGGYLDTLDFESTQPSTDPSAFRNEPTRRALDAAETVVVTDVSERLREAAWREHALVCGYRSVMAIPLSYEDLDYGVLTLYADRVGTFDGEFGELLAELGDTIADAINSIETRRSLRSESFVELELHVDAPDALLVRLADALGEPIRIDGTVPQEGDRSLVYVDAAVDLESASSTVHGVESVRRLDGGTARRTELSVAGRTVADRLATHGANVDSLVATATDIDATVTLPRSVSVRSFVEALDERYDAVELRSRRDGETVEERSFGSATVADRLTDRQYEAVRTAYLAGYFEWPRTSTGEEVAGAMGITQPTFNRHLRTSERKLFSAVFGGIDPDE
ncbi:MULTISPECIES: bacterio-opsin activator domain-containing protein [Haloferacaceae]|uniref:Bacterio-opsin activator domain-containing protein n=1 Tax=Halorubrum glutamatedens TaxID=2707018 RepID=A0ABD5QS30_9EURY|nr:bacterio-opsin activator domain-containing protein [Halobellus captivus]